MAINPISYTEKVVRSFLRYQLTAYPFSDPRLHEQMRRLLNLDEVRRTPLLKGPYISLSKSFKQGPTVTELVNEGILHPHMKQIIGTSITHLYDIRQRLFGHPQRKNDVDFHRHRFGQTECFLYPLSANAQNFEMPVLPSGITAVIIYPMNALAEDQLDRLRGLLAGSGITFGMYVGKTPEYEKDVSGYRLQPGSTRADYEEVLRRYRDQGRPDAVHPAEEVCSREMMRTPDRQPRILLAM